MPTGTSMGRTSEITSAYTHCRTLARHYENFPVGSLLFPRDVRDAFHAVYAFARAADDMADEGALPLEERLRRLDAWERELDATIAGTAHDPVFVALGDTMSRLAIPDAPFRKLLSAFRQDVRILHYERFSDVLAYCARSANPVGEIVLRLFGKYDSQTGPLSDHICTALQLTNFWQDVAVDYAIGRIYIPQEDLQRFGVDPSHIARHEHSSAFRELMRFQVERTFAIFDEGAPLVSLLHGRLRVEIGWVLASGREALAKIARNDFDVLTKSNRLSVFSRGLLFARAVFAKRT